MKATQLNDRDLQALVTGLSLNFHRDAISTPATAEAVGLLSDSAARLHRLTKELNNRLAKQAGRAKRA